MLDQFQYSSFIFCLQSFCWSTGISKTLASKVPFSIDICKEMFEKLNTLLSLCDSSESTLGGTSSWFSESSDQVCLYTLNLLKLQVRLFYRLTNWLMFLCGQIQSPRPDVMPDRRKGIARAEGFVAARIETSVS